MQKKNMTKDCDVFFFPPEHDTYVIQCFKYIQISLFSNHAMILIRVFAAKKNIIFRNISYRKKKFQRNISLLSY